MLKYLESHSYLICILCNIDLEKNISEYELIACEFNIEPPNLISKKFHESLNYENVGYQLTENETKKVSLMIKKIL